MPIVSQDVAFQDIIPTSDKTDAIGITISLDYCFVVPLERTADTCPVLVVYGNFSKSFLCVTGWRKKGAVKFVGDWMVEKMDEARCRGQRITLESDGEASILALEKAVAAARTWQTALIESPVRGSKANGAV